MNEVNKKTNVGKIIKNSLTGLIVLVFIASIVLMFVGSKKLKENKLLFVLGYSYSVVPTPSMEPNIHVNDLILIKKVDFEDIGMDDIVVYYNHLSNKNIVHRIKIDNGDGTYVTKGDNNNNYDLDVLLNKDNYLGKVVKSGSFLGLGKLILNGRRFIFLLIIIIFLLLLVSEVINIIKISKEKEQKKALEEKNKDVEEQKELLRLQVKKELEEELQKTNGKTKEI